MDIKGFFRRNWAYFAVIGIGLLVMAVFFKPQFEGYGVKQHDIKEALGMSNETNMYRDATGEEPKWTSSAFGGMPTEQISMIYPGNWLKSVYISYIRLFPGALGLIFLHFISFIIFARLLRLNPWIGLLGAVAFSFGSYEMIVIQAGHVSKSLAAAFLPAILGAFIYAYKTNRIWGILLAGFFMSLELTVNHVQVTYYFLFILFFLGIYFFIEAVRQNELKKFLITSAGMIGIFLLAFAINSGNILMTNDYAKYSIRGGNDVTIAPDGTLSSNRSTGLDRDYITQWSYGIGETFTLISPYVKGGASEQIADSPFAEQIMDSDMSQEEINGVLQNYSYWGTQPITSGPVYVGIVVSLLAFLGLFFLRDRIKWPLFAVTILAILLSWGKNFMGLTNFFIDYIPAYNKFRAVTIILIIVEVTIPVMGVLFLNELIKQREQIIAQKKKFMLVLGGFIAFLIVVTVAGLGDGYSNPAEAKQFAGLSEIYTKQIMQMDPQVAMSQYNLNIGDPQQVRQFVDLQVNSQLEAFAKVKEAREGIFTSSMSRSILFSFLAGGLFMVFLFAGSDKTATVVLVGGLVVLTFADLIPVAYNYLGGIERASGGYKYWEDIGLSYYPVAATKADEEILRAEISRNPALAKAVAQGEAEGKKRAEELEYSTEVSRNIVNAYRFQALKMATNYRVLDFAGGFSDSRASYFHKSLGGYHGAKLRNINNLIDFQLSKTNNKVLDMLNVKYFLQSDRNTGLDTAILNPTALGNAWLVENVRQVASPNDEIRALGNKFMLENRGAGMLLINGTPVKRAAVYGGEKLRYYAGGNDTLEVPLTNGLQKGQEALFVMDVNGKTNLIPLMTMQIDTAKSFRPLVYLKVESTFEPESEAIMLSSEAAKLKAKKFSGEGTINLTSFRPNRLTYSADVKGNQLAVFSEIYYPMGWKAFVDGKEMPILKVDYLLRGLELTNGHHKIEFVYDLPKYKTANTIARLGSILLIALFGFALFNDWRNRKKAVN